MPRCSLCEKRRKLDGIGLCKPCREGLDPSERAFIEGVVKQGLPIPRCALCDRRGQVDEVGICEPCRLDLDPSEREFIERVVREGLPIPTCSRCCRRGMVDHDGLCSECLDDPPGLGFEGAMCSRCEIDLTSEGYCPNDRCPFSWNYQDEAPPDVDYPSEEEWRYVEEVIRPRLRKEWGERSNPGL